MKNILYLYNATQTYTNTVYEHIACFANYSRNRSFFCHQDSATIFNVDLSRFDAIAIHYSIRLPYDQLSPSVAQAIANFKGLKLLFIQDEYDFVHRTWYWIKHLGLQLVFTVVPQQGISKVYPRNEFPNTKFISILTGYVPDHMRMNQRVTSPSQRMLMIGYRGRPLPIRYGQLGLEKISIGKDIKLFCDEHCIKNDIAWTEESRIYGPKWYEFMMTCRSMLGSESGSNVFDWDGSLEDEIKQFRKLNSNISDSDVYEKIISPKEINGIMNQISPRIFEAIATKTVLLLYEGSYSGVIKAGVHFIAIKKDGSNLAEVMHLLRDDDFVDAISERAYRDVIDSGNYSYKTFVSMIDDVIDKIIKDISKNNNDDSVNVSKEDCHADSTAITTAPIRAKPPQKFMVGDANVPRLIIYLWRCIVPDSVKLVLKPKISQLFRKD
jgi:hypothetical protein